MTARPLPSLFPTADAVSAAALHADVLRYLADPGRGAPETIQALADALGRADRSNFGKELKILERDGLIVRDAPDTPTGLKLTPAGERAAQAVALAVGDVEVDLDARMIEHGRIRPNPLNPRKSFDEAELSGLADNIEANLHRGGVLQNLTVYPADADGVHVIYAGERRWRAVGRLIGEGRVAGDFRLPCRIREPDALEAAAQTASVALSENGQRKNLSMAEELRAWEAVIAGWSGTLADCARAHGRDVRTVQEFAKVLREAAPEALAAHDRGELKWEELRDSVKKLSLKPHEALAVLELTYRQTWEDAGLEDDAGGPPWVCVTQVPTGCEALIGRGVLEFTHHGGDVLARVRTDNPKVEQFLREAGLHDTPLVCLYQAREVVVGAFEAGTLEKTGELATKWARFPDLPAVRPEDGFFTGTAAELKAKLEADADTHGRSAAHPPALQTREPHETSAPIPRPHEAAHARQDDDGADVDPAGDAPDAREVRGSASDPREAQENQEGHEGHEDDAETAQAAAPLGALGDLGGSSSAAEPRPPSSEQLLALTEIAHKTAHDPVEVATPEGLANAARVVFDRFFDPTLNDLAAAGWVERIQNGALTAARVTHLGVRQIDPRGLLAVDDLATLMHGFRADAGLSLTQRHELTQTGRYAFAPLNTAAPPKPLTPDLPTLSPAAALILVELAACIAREGREIAGKPWRSVECWDYHLDRNAQALAHERLAGWFSHRSAWMGYLTERGRDWLRAHDVDPDMVSEADLARFRADAGVARPEAGWSTAFLNPKPARDAGPAPRAPAPAPAGPASGARAPTALDGAMAVLDALIDAAEPVLAELAAIARQVAKADAEKAYAMEQRRAALAAEISRARHFADTARAHAKDPADDR